MESRGRVEREVGEKKERSNKERERRERIELKAKQVREREREGGRERGELEKNLKYFFIYS